MRLTPLLKQRPFLASLRYGYISYYIGSQSRVKEKLWHPISHTSCNFLLPLILQEELSTQLFTQLYSPLSPMLQSQHHLIQVQSQTGNAYIGQETRVSPKFPGVLKAPSLCISKSSALRQLRISLESSPQSPLRLHPVVPTSTHAVSQKKQSVATTFY